MNAFIIFWLFIVLSILAVVPILDIFVEKKLFNDGVCRDCGNNLKRFGFDNTRGNAYYCDKCGYCTWVSWKIVDRKYLKEKE